MNKQNREQICIIWNRKLVRTDNKDGIENYYILCEQKSGCRTEQRIRWCLNDVTDGQANMSGFAAAAATTGVHANCYENERATLKFGDLLLQQLAEE